MTPTEAVDYMNGVLLAAWVADSRSATYLYWTDVPKKKPTGEVVWARATVQHVNGRRASLANTTRLRRFRNEGIYTVQIFTPIGDGSVADYSVAQMVKRALEVAQNGNLWFSKIKLIEVPVTEAFAQINVLANFSYDDVR